MMIDRLEPRLQFATLAGSVFNDADRSHYLEAGETPFADQTVFIDANNNGTLDGGEQTTTTDADGRYTFTGLAAGDYTIGTTVDAPATFTSTTATADGTKQGRFNIELVGLDSPNVTPAVKAAFAMAAAKWEAVIIGDIADVTTPGGDFIDDIRITAKLGSIDGVGNILGYAGPDAFRPEDDTANSFLPYAGSMRFDTSDLAQLQKDKELNDVILHEMGHVLGIGTIWGLKGLLTGGNSRQPAFVGENATREYNALYATENSTNLSVPVENDFGGGTRESHWRENILNEELMTGFIGTTVDDGVDEDGNPIQIPLSRITVGSMEDLGYEVDYDAADEWEPETHEVTETVGTDYGAVAHERTITLGSDEDVSDFDFGYITATKPKIGAFTTTPFVSVTPGFPLILTARSVSDADFDELSSVSFYLESNGQEGLQRDDTKLATRGPFSKAGAFKLQVGTDDLTGTQTYYAIATDVEGRTGRRTGTVFVGEPSVPENIPNSLTATRLSSTSVNVGFEDPGTDVLGYRFELSTNSRFTSDSIIKTFNISSDARDVDIIGLTPGTTYYVHVRAYNSVGPTRYSPTLSFELV